MSDKEKDDGIQIKVVDEDTVDSNEATMDNDQIEDEDKPIEEMSKQELIEKLDRLQEKVDKNYDQYLRSQAEMENIIKRNKKEKEDWIKYANETLIKELLPVMDNLEKAISFSREKNSLDALKEGVELTLKNLKDTLTKSGLEEVEAQGKAFDPAYHHAVSEQDAEDTAAGIILHELQKGYMLHQRLIRPAMVVLSKGAPDK
jgi:molecular chaperone GrpE